MGTWYPFETVRGVYVPWITDITALIRYSCIMVTIRRKWNWRFFAMLGLGDFNDENPQKLLRCVGRGGI